MSIHLKEGTSQYTVTSSDAEVVTIGEADYLSYHTTVTINSPVTNCYMNVLWSNDNTNWVQATQTQITDDGQVIGTQVSPIGFNYLKIQWVLDSGEIEVNNSYCLRQMLD